MKYIVLLGGKMANTISKKLRRWEKDDRAEEAGNEIRGEIERLGKVISRLDMLLGSAVTSLIFFLSLLVLHAFGKI